MTKQKVPKLRFPEFTGEWEEKKLGEIIKFLSDYTANGSFASLKNNVTYYQKENYAVLVRTTDLLKREFIPQRFTDKKGYEYLKKTSLFGGELVLANVGSIGKVFEVPNYDKPMTLAPNTYVIKFNEYIFQKFIYHWMTTQAFLNKILSLVGSSTLKAINKSNLRGIKIQLPSLPEQEKIADFLTLFDKELELEEKKLELLKENKKGYMQKIFSQEIRFKDEFGNYYPQWEEKILGEVFNITRGYVLSKNELKSEAEKDYIYPVYSSQTKNGGVMGYYKNFLYEDSITWTTDGANAGIVNYRKGKFYCTNVCGVLLSKKGYSNKCIAEILNKKTKNYVSYVGNPKLMNGIVAQIKIPFPSLQEQEKIANLLSTADEEIELMENKVEKLKEIKKGLLQQMFI